MLHPSLKCVSGGEYRLPHRGAAHGTVTGCCCDACVRAEDTLGCGLSDLAASKQFSVTREDRQCRYCYTFQQGSRRDPARCARGERAVAVGRNPRTARERGRGRDGAPGDCARTDVRVTGGRLGGRRLRAAASGTRPSADRVRVALFARLGDLDGARVLDLYAGSGALGIEALSRGAARGRVHRARVAQSRRAARESRPPRPGDATPASSPATRCAASGGSAARAARFDLVLLDPPYAVGRGRAGARRRWRPRSVLAAGAAVVVESGRRHPLPSVGGTRARSTSAATETR